MTAPEPTPTAEHVDAVARVLFMGFHDMVCPEGADCRMREPHAASYGWFDATGLAGAILTSTDPAVHAALAASLPAEVMLAALVDRGMLTEFQTDARLNEDGSLTTDAYIEHCNVKAMQFVTSWEVAP